MKKYPTWDEYLISQLKDPEQARIYLEVALEEFETDENPEALLLALRRVAEARGGVGKLAKKVNCPRQSVYKMLSAQGNPTLSKLPALLHGLGFKLSIVPLDSKRG